MKVALSILFVLLASSVASSALAADLCAGVSSSVTLSELTIVGEDSIQAKGTWTVAGGAGGAAGVMLETRIDSDRIFERRYRGFVVILDLPVKIKFSAKVMVVRLGVHRR